jgi:uncharacterized protein
MKLSKSLIEILKAKSHGLTIAYLTTASFGGKPNVLPLPFTDVVEDELILFPDLFAQKTKVNLNENIHASISIFNDATNIQTVIEGTADVIQWGHPSRFKLFGLEAGAVLERWGDWDETVEAILEASEESARPSVYAQRGVIVFRPEKIVEVNQ